MVMHKIKGGKNEKYLIWAFLETTTANYSQHKRGKYRKKEREREVFLPISVLLFIEVSSCPPHCTSFPPSPSLLPSDTSKGGH